MAALPAGARRTNRYPVADRGHYQVTLKIAVFSATVVVFRYDMGLKSKQDVMNAKKGVGWGFRGLFESARDSTECRDNETAT